MILKNPCYLTLKTELMYLGRQAGCTGVLHYSRDLGHLDTGSGTQLCKVNQNVHSQ